MKKIAKVICLFLLLILIALLVVMVYRQEEKAAVENIDHAGETVNAALPTKVISYGGEEAKLKRMTSTLLLIGTDNYENEKSDITSFYNTHMGDFLTLLVFDDNNKTCTPIQISRETMCEVPWLSVNGKVGGTTFEQITFAHTYGSGGNDSCKNVCSAVSSLLFDVPVDHYMSFTMAAVPIINDAVGGVEVTIEDDLTHLNPEFVPGTTIRLKGEKALQFVRTRDTSITESNVARMGRQRQYIAGFITQAKKASRINDNLALKTFEMISPYLTTDLSGEMFLSIADKLEEYSILPVLYPEGEVKLGERWAEFYPDMDSLFEIVKQSICE